MQAHIGPTAPSCSHRQHHRPQYHSIHACTHSQQQRAHIVVAKAGSERASAATRRTLLGLAGTAGLAGILPVRTANAAVAEDAFDLFRKAFPAPPQPIMFPRGKLDIKFAVLLMRSCYAAVDLLDFIPMDKFQIAFWKQRASEQEGYMLQYSPLKVRMGDLTDPLYFDYISYSQFATIGREMPRGQQVFQEPCDEECDFKPRTVRRDASIADNKVLPARFVDLSGDLILKGLQQGFRDEQFGAPPSLPSTAPASEVVQKLQELLDIMVARGFALKAQILDVNESSDGRGASFCVKLQGTANLWGLASLTFRRSPVVNNYSAMVVAAYIRSCGRRVTSYDIEYTDTYIEEEWAFE